MKLRKVLSLILAALLVAGLLAGCGAANTDAGAKDFIENDSKYDNELSTSESIAGSQLPENQKLIRKVWLEAETEAMDALLADVEARVAELGGYIEARRVYNGSAYSTARRYRYADLTVRIPAQKLDTFVDRISEVSNITSANETTENVTLSYVATQSRLTALQAEEARLLELMAIAENLDDLLLIEQRLTDVRTELEAVTSQLRLYDNQIDYGTVYLSVEEVTEYTVEADTQTVWDRISGGFVSSLKNVGNGATELFIFLIVSLPYLLILTGVTVGIILLAKRKKKKKKNNAAKPQLPPKQDEQL